MSFSDYTSLEPNGIYKKLETSADGLTPNSAKELLSKFGPNKLKSDETTGWDIFKRQFRSPFVYLLLAASTIAYIIGERIDSYMILGFVIINSFLGFYQEYKSEQTVKLLKKYLAKKATILRDGKPQNIEAENIVPGDVLVFEPGDIIPADVRFISDYNLMVDETVLTGESVQISKTSESAKKAVEDIYHAGNIGFSGTTVVSGEGRGVVIATGEDTNYAKIVKLASETKKQSSFEMELGRFSKFTLWVVLATLIFIVITSIAVKPNPSLTDLIIFSIALAVSVIPETLPVVTTFSLSLGAHRLSQKSVIVKRLSAVEDLGSLQVLASDKTGTLTENKLKVMGIKSDDKEKMLFFAALASVYSESSKNAGNNAFDKAFNEVLSAGQKKEIKTYRKVAEIPFDPNRKRITALVERKGKKYLITRGSVENVCAYCKGLLNKPEIENWHQKEGEEGRRSLAVAIKEVRSGADEDISKANLESMEHGMKFLGMVSFSDPIKPSTYKAIEKAKQLGVSVKVITGDSKEVAGAVAKEIGLIDDLGSVITGAEFEALNIDKKHEAVQKYSVFARIIPEQKHQIISLLKEKSYVGFLGEGINDAPALKAANVAVVVDEASDVAKEAADIVLLKRDLEVIMDGVIEGRRIFANTSKYITATMASNFGNFFAVAIITPFIDFLPLLPLQILMVNLLTDFPMVMVATDTVDSDDLRIPRKYDIKRFATSALSFGMLSTAFDFITFRTFYPLGEASLQTYWFIVSVFTELLLIFSIRSKRPLFLTKSPSRPMVLLTIGVFAFTLIIPYTTLGDSFFGFIRPEIGKLGLVFGIVVAYLLSNEVAKALIKKYSAD